MKRLLIFVFLFICAFAKGQVYQLMPQYGYDAKRMKFDSTLQIPTFCGTPSLRSNILNKSAIAYDSCNKRFYYYDPKLAVWDTIKGGGGASIDTTSLSNRINGKADTSQLSLKLNKSDSLIYYTKYRSDTSRTNIYTAISSKGQNGRWGNDTATIVLAKVHNSTGTTLTRGTVVMMNGANGDVASVIRANNKYDSTSARTIGVVKDAISAGDTGWVVTQGQASKLNLGSFTAGDVLYLDSIDGGLTKTKPKAPNHIVFIGIVERANNGNGLLYTKPQNGYELDEIHDVRITSPINNQVLVYSDTQQLWKNRNVYSIVDTTGLSNRINAKPNLNATSTYIPYREGSNFRDSYLVNDTTNKVLKSVYSVYDIGLQLDFANNLFGLGAQSGTYNSGVGFIVDYINGKFAIGDVPGTQNEVFLEVDAANNYIKSISQGNDIGLKLDFANSDYNIGTATKNFQVKNDSLKINGLIGQSGDSVVNITNSGKLGKISIAGKVNVADTASMLTNYQRTSAFPIATFGAGSGAAGDTSAFTTSAIYGSFYLNAGSDTIIVTGYTGVVQGTSASVTPTIWYNDSLNVTAGATKIVNTPSAVTSTTTGNTVTSLDNTKIPPGNFVWVTTGTVTKKPTYFNLTLIGYRKR